MSASHASLHPTDTLAVPTTSKQFHGSVETDSGAEMDYVTEEEIPLDAKHLNRVHEELEKLNIATDVINKLELQLDDARNTFRQIQTFWSQKLNDLSKKYGSAVEKARPYYEAKLEERRLREEAQNAAIRFERANSMHAVAKQQVKLTQDSLNRQKIIEPECLEVLNHHIQRVNEAEKERLIAEESHRAISERMCACAQRIAQMEKESSRSIKKSRRYFEQRIEFSRVLDAQKSLILRLEAEVRQKKVDYTTSLRNLEQISDSIHEERSLSSMKREAGVGCESPDPPPNESARLARSSSLSRPVDERSAERRRHDSRSAVLHSVEKKMDELGVSCDKGLDPTLFDEDSATESLDWHDSRTASLGSGVILLAQQLMGGSDKARRLQHSLKISSDMADFRYQTALPEGVQSGVMCRGSIEASDSDTSFSSARIIENAQEIGAVIRSSSSVILEGSHIPCGMLPRSVSDVERESASGESSSGF